MMVNNLGNKATMSKNIRYYLEKKNITQADLASALNIPVTTISNWIHANTYPRIDKIEMMANYFGITKADLVEEPNNSTSSTCISIPVLGRVAAGIPLDAVEYIVDTEEISERLANTGEFFGLKIKGDSMEPRICNGDVVIVRQQEDAESGDIVIALVNGNDATCKRLSKYATGLSLNSFNTKYEPMVFSNDEIEQLPVKIIGKVVELRGKF